MQARRLSLSVARVAMTATFIGLVSNVAVHAADDPCQALGKVLNGRAQIIQEVQSYREKKPTADQACSAFTKLAKLNVNAVAAVERDGAWCRAPEDLAGSLKSQQNDIDAARKNACKAAVEMKKAQKNGGAGAPAPFGGSDGILGGDTKLPQGAL
ncbi:MAG: hypothetical protein FJX04_08655 [Alphaproteobacteria bacterium]|nr:hypothetical protein [Alphaproteobacteria bacterium]